MGSCIVDESGGSITITTMHYKVCSGKPLEGDIRCDMIVELDDDPIEDCTMLNIESNQMDMHCRYCTTKVKC
jgi:hypothetical protein